MSGVSTVHATTGLPVAACAETRASAYSGRSRPMSIATAPETSACLEDQPHARLESARLHLRRHVDGIPVGAEVRQVGAQRLPALERERWNLEARGFRRVGRHDATDRPRW